MDPALPQIPGYDFVENDTLPQDAFPGGHGTGVAGLVLGVAPDAQILPLRVCDQTGTCRASWVVGGGMLGIGPRPPPTVLNLSLGGDTPVALLESVLGLALVKGYPVAAAAGKQGQYGSPAHYPAAFPLAGLVAVGALDPAPAPPLAGPQPSIAPRAPIWTYPPQAPTSPASPPEGGWAAAPGPPSPPPWWQGRWRSGSRPIPAWTQSSWRPSSSPRPGHYPIPRMQWERECWTSLSLTPPGLPQMVKQAQKGGQGA